MGLQSYRLKLPDSWLIHDVFHVSKLTPFKSPAFPSQSAPSPVPAILADDAPVLASVLDSRALRNTSHFLVLLAGQDREDARWLSLADARKIPDPNNILGLFLMTR